MTGKHIPPVADDEDRCKHDLIKAHCGYCRHPRLRRRVPTEAETPLFIEPDDSLLDDAIVHSFAAAYGGRCWRCGNHYARGAWISKVAGGDYICSTCAENPE